MTLTSPYHHAELWFILKPSPSSSKRTPHLAISLRKDVLLLFSSITSAIAPRAGHKPGQVRIDIRGTEEREDRNPDHDVFGRDNFAVLTNPHAHIDEKLVESFATRETPSVGVSATNVDDVMLLHCEEEPKGDTLEDKN